MFWLKSCPRCHGDLYEDRDLHGRYIACLQCSHHLSPAQEVGLYLSPAFRRPAGFKDVSPAELINQGERDLAGAVELAA